MELYKKYRPKCLDELVGQEGVVAALKKKLAQKNLPHTILLHGPSGCGKTSTARALAKELGCHLKLDYIELNAAESRGIDDVKSISMRMHLAPMHGPCKVWVLDECHAFTGPAQQALLKTLEDTPGHVYFFLCTTLPNKLLDTIRNRGMPFALKALSTKTMESLLGKVLKAEKLSVGEEALDKVIELANGSPRHALNLLDKITAIEGEEEQLRELDKASEESTGFQIAQHLMNPRSQWTDVAKLLRDLSEEVETVRRVVLGYAASVLLKGKRSDRAYLILTVFESAWYDSGKPGLVRACYEVMGSK